ncbi:hypothetical protein BRD18_04280 [Halobacteriales archaeon SW_7_71_33]|nr:MAG: hypothetical protein BRD18_04280 [Halobacteriales archaeon SW_7_71_33]
MLWGWSGVTNRPHRAHTYLSDTELERLEQTAEEFDMTRSELLRRAIREYCDHDRNARVEDRLDRIEETLSRVAGTLAADTDHTHTHKPATNAAASKTAERARTIARYLQQRHETPIRESDIDKAIEDVAGGDPRTIEKYRGRLKKRCLAFEHPGVSPVWTTDREEFVGWVADFAAPDENGIIRVTPGELRADYGLDDGQLREWITDIAGREAAAEVFTDA